MRRLAAARAAAGFTLLEVLVVLVIIGIITAMATISVRVLGGDHEMQQEAERLQAILQQSREDAMLQSRDIGLRIERGELLLSALFDEDMLGDDLEAWLAESALMKRTFRTCAVIAGLIERRFPGKEKSRRAVTISTDLVYDVLRRHQGDHILLRAARAGRGRRWRGHRPGAASQPRRRPSGRDRGRARSSGSR